MGIAVILGKSSIEHLFSEGIFPHCRMICAMQASCIDCQSAVVALIDNATHNRINCAALIINSDITAEISLPENSTPIITCGRGSKNSVSVSSITDERITISLNRSIQTLNGICEPLEQSFPLLNDIPIYDYMAAFAISIVLGTIS